ncbi:MAG: hypothetical protein KatS3mg002_1375 [Candidatus Woesearchaeota archaeon]|nr:MAG: hypothetical protein KatS3mg002_1375 [Candidatus Woesearchaeota archaeon]
MATLQSNKVRIDKILVADGNAPLATAGTKLSALTTHGKLGFYNQSTNLATVPLFETDPVIFIAQGQSTTNHTYPLTPRPQERSMPIDGERVVSVYKTAYSAPTNNVWVIGDANGQAGEINVADDTTYELTIKFDGRRVDILNGRNQPAIFPQFTTPDYSSNGPATEVLQRDHLIQNLVFEVQQQSVLKRESGAQIVVLAVADSANTGNTSGITLSAIAASPAGTSFIVGYNADGSAVNWVPTASEKLSITNAIAQIVTNGVPTGLTGANELVLPVVINPPAGSTAAAAISAGTAALAGTSTNATYILVIVRDDSTAFFDRIPQTKVSVDIGLRQGFNVSTVHISEVEYAFEGTGVGRHWALAYDESDALRKYDTSQVPGEYAIQYPSPVDPTATYNSYTITHSLPVVTSAGTVSLNPYETIVLIESGDTVTSADFEDQLRGWLDSLPVVPAYNF